GGCDERPLAMTTRYKQGVRTTIDAPSAIAESIARSRMRADIAGIVNHATISAAAPNITIVAKISILIRNWHVSAVASAITNHGRAIFSSNLSSAAHAEPAIRRTSRNAVSAASAGISRVARL